MDFDSILDQASLAETTLTLCLNGKLRAQYDRLRADIDERTADNAPDPSDERLSTRPYVDPQQPDLDRLAEEIRKHSVEFTLRALPKPEWNDLFLKHPPRTDKQTGRRNERDRFGVNYDTFFPALVRSAIAHPELTDDRWTRLFNALSDAQFNKLANAAWDLNQVDDDVPFSLVSSPSRRNSAES